MNPDKLGLFIAKLRKEKNMTQKELAEKLGVTDRAVSNWENGRRLPDVSLYKEICDILGITLNEFFAGEKIKEEDFKNVADNNLLSALENSIFTLKDKVDFFKRKWQHDHFFELTITMLIIVFFIIFGFIKNNGLQIIFIILGFVSGIVENNRMMAYVERNAYGKNSGISIEELRLYIKRLSEAKEILENFKTKKEAVDYLVNETGINREECSSAYDILINLDLDKIKKAK